MELIRGCGGSQRPAVLSWMWCAIKCSWRGTFSLFDFIAIDVAPFEHWITTILPKSIVQWFCVVFIAAALLQTPRPMGMTQFTSNLWSLSSGPRYGMIQLRALGFLYKRTIVQTLLLHCCFTATEYEARLVRINFQISWIRCCDYYLSCCSILCRHYLSVISICLERSCRPFS